MSTTTPADQAPSENESLKAIAGVLGVGVPKPEGQPEAAPPVEAAQAEAQPAAPIDPLAIVLPDSPDVPEKFRKQSLRKVLESQAEAERAFHENAGRIKNVSYELELQRNATDALKEQLESLRKAVTPAPVAPNPFEGLNLQEDVILRPDQVFERLRELNRRESEEIAKREAERVKSDLQSRREAEIEYTSAVRAAEVARESLGYKDKPEWFEVLTDIAPAVFSRRADGAHLDPRAYVNEFNSRRTRYGGQQQVVQVQVQGNAPVVSKASQGSSAPPPAKPQLSPKYQERAEHIASIYGLDPGAFLARIATKENS